MVGSLGEPLFFLEDVMCVSVLEFGWAGKKGGQETEDSAFDSTLPVGEVRSARYCQGKAWKKETQERKIKAER